MIDFREKKERTRLRRPCNRCNKMFVPTGWCSHLCDKCKEINKKEKAARLKAKKKQREANKK